MRSSYPTRWNGGDAVLARLGELDAEEARRRRTLLTAAGVALTLHTLVAWLVPRPESRPAALPELRVPIELYPTPRWVEPPRLLTPPKPVARRVPMPDPTPDEPEPIVTPEPPRPLVELSIDPGTAAIPTPPPEPEIYVVGGEVSAPVKLESPDPVYPGAALVARRGGVVVIQATIDRQGRVTALVPLTHRGFGLEEAAMAAMAQWRFRPAQRRGQPVPVLYQLTVNFQVVR